MAGLPEDRDVWIRDGLVAGNESALTEVYDLFGSVVYGVAVQITHDRGAAEDIVQETFVELWRRPERFEPGRAPLRGWLCMIARRRAIDWTRRVGGHAHSPMTPADEPSVTFEDDLLEATEHKKVRKAVANLPAPHRQAIMLAFYHGLSYREVARSLNIPEGTAKWRMRSALRRIGEQLMADGFDEAS